MAGHELMPAWKDAALLLVAHGSSRLTTGREPTARLAEVIRERHLFAEVEACFWKEPPFPSLDLVRAPLVYVIPNFAGEGTYTRRLIPQKLGLAGPVTEVAGRRIVYGPPVGCHPGLPALLRRRAEDLCAANRLDPATVALLIIGHGSRQPGAAGGTPEAVARTIRAAGVFAEVATSYIEQEPHVADWPRLVGAPVVIAAPWLIAEGMHASQDLPPLFGLATPSGGPSLVADRRVWLLGGIGRAPEVVTMILDQVRAAECAAAH